MNASKTIRISAKDMSAYTLTSARKNLSRHFPQFLSHEYGPVLYFLLEYVKDYLPLSKDEGGKFRAPKKKKKKKRTTWQKILRTLLIINVLL